MENKSQQEDEKKTIEKYKKPRFFERVKLMRKLKQAKLHMEQASDQKEQEKYTKEYVRCEQDMMYIFYYPKSSPYISLFPSKPHTDEQIAT